MATDTFPTPEAAAMQGFPVAHCRVLAVDLSGEDGFAVLDTGPEDYRYLYAGTVKCVDGGWVGGSDGNGGTVGWTLTDREREVGVVALWDEAPPGADAVRVVWRGEVREAPVRDGVYLVTWWREPDPKDARPRVASFRIGGRWVPAVRR